MPQKLYSKQFFSQYFERWKKSWKYKFFEYNFRSDRKLFKQKNRENRKTAFVYIYYDNNS